MSPLASLDSFFLLPHNLAVNAISELVNGRIEIVALRIGEDLASNAVQRCFGALMVPFNADHHMHVGDMVVMPHDALEFLFDVGLDGFGDIKMMSADT